MTLRVAAALALALGVLGLLGFLHLLGEGPFVPPEGRHMRAMKERSKAPPHPEPAGIALFVSLPYRRPLVEYAPFEQRGVVVEGYVKHMLRAPDGDTHLEFAPAWSAPGPAKYVTAEITPEWYRGAAHWQFQSLRNAFRAGSGGDATVWDEPPRRVRITGWLMYDYQFETRRKDLTIAPNEERVSGWEVHPVTKIEIWDDHRAAFVEVPR